ncbi:MAG: phasin family protein [Telmatospirillum sp.]|nr:phasin family protein [Telmatospirillum sp.]
MTTPKSVKSAATPAADTAKQIEEAVAVHQETIETVVKAGADVATQGVQKAVALSKDHVEAAAKAGEDAFKGYEDLLQFNKDNFEAWLKSGTVVARGVQDLSKTFAVLAQETLEQTVAASRALASARTLKEVIDTSSSLARSNFDRLVVEGSRIRELSTRLAEEAIAPINSRVDAAVQRLTRHAA